VKTYRRLRLAVTVFGIAGYAVACAVQALPQRFWAVATPRVIEILVPITFFTMRFPVDISWSTILLFIGPINAVFYAAIGLAVVLIVPRPRSSSVE
jgi:hypothetical protein